MNIGRSSLNDIAKIRPDSVKRRRISSYDKTGGNIDWITITPGEKITIAEEKGAGCITHIWCTMASRAKHFLRNIIIRMYWDGEPEDKPSVEVPIGDFFGMGHAKHKNFVSLPLQMSPRNGRGFNCWWPMPYSNGFKITIENDTSKKFKMYFYVDYEFYEEEFDDSNSYGRFHAQWRRENPPVVKKADPETGKKFKKRKPIKFMFSGKNREPLKYNYKILEAKGKGHYVGCHLDIDNITFLPWFLNWPGEGDDMIFIDENIEKATPTLYGTGTEDYVNQAYSQSTKYNAPYHGTILPGGFNWWGKITYYRYHIEDPIYFNKQIIVSIEHGHDNHRRDDWSSTSYWYQIEPHDHNVFPKLLNQKDREPRSHIIHTIRKSFCILLILLMITLIWVYFFYLI
ncbi:MAG: glycoside hydrolase family 172 protein [Candidatus Hodarchaeota archaeon]